MDTKEKSALSAVRNDRPECIELVRDAILALDERNGSSAKAITEHIILSKLLSDEVAEEQVRAALLEGLERGSFDQVGCSHYKEGYHAHSGLNLISET